jgi:hypothetical protein
VDEHGKVQLCASQMGRLGTPIEEYTSKDLDEQARTYKGCEEGCSVGCAFRCSLLDNDKPQFIQSVLKGYVKGTMSNNGRRRQGTTVGAPLPGTAGVSDD